MVLSFSKFIYLQFAVPLWKLWNSACPSDYKYVEYFKVEPTET